MTRVQPMLCRIEAPSLRTQLVVETPTPVVWGATGLPTSAPTRQMVLLAESTRRSIASYRWRPAP